jgi:transcriptional regulator with XRE-family HTH domain
MTALATADSDFGTMLRTWRSARRMSQLELASVAGVSSRHLSFIETGRARPSREMVVHLAEQLDVPLRERNTLLTAAGFAPLYRETPLSAPEMAQARAAIDRVLESHPYPAIAVDRKWDVVNANDKAFMFLEGIPAEVLDPLNVYRVCLHPDGLSSRILNFDEYADHMLSRLEHQVSVSADAELIALQDEMRGYVGRRPSTIHVPTAQVLLPMRLHHGDHVLSFMSTISVFGTPVDITLAELALEMFFPADADTAALLS